MLLSRESVLVALSAGLIAAIGDSAGGEKVNLDGGGGGVTRRQLLALSSAVVQTRNVTMQGVEDRCCVVKMSFVLCR